MTWTFIACGFTQAQLANAPVYRLSPAGLVRSAPPLGANQSPPSTAYINDALMGHSIAPQTMLPAEFDPWIGPPTPSYDPSRSQCVDCKDSWTWHVLPQGLVYRSYLAGVKEPRLNNTWIYENDVGNLWDATLGGRVALLRYGSQGGPLPQGWELGVEGAAFVRLDMDDERDLVAADFRAGVPLTYAYQGNEFKLAFYHLSAHIGDEFLLKNPSFVRINYSRDVIVFGYAFRPNDTWRFYAEAGYGVQVDGGAEPWEFQFGIEYSTMRPTGPRGAPFVATNAQLHQEVDFGGRYTIQAGWQWRGEGAGHLFRVGVQHLNGLSPQYQFFGSNQNEQQTGVGIWYDF